ncbi:hypothetical protein LCGC14_2458580 [marine sediment metagenome]|uniref:Uncharacterized protein n=2 Tax=root TaxID=1 RepID=A0A831QSM4_9FLAO|nr:hypothetical protein [Pricia antarctica]
MNPKNETPTPKYRLVALAFGCTVFLASCNKEDTIETNSVETAFEATTEEVSQDDEFIAKYFMGTEVKVKLEKYGTYILAGSDLRLFQNQLSDSAVDYNHNPVPTDDSADLVLQGAYKNGAITPLCMPSAV